VNALIIILLACGWSTPSPSVPDALENLEPLLQDEQSALDAIRRFDLYQQNLAEWDLHLARQFVVDGEKDLAADKEKQARARFDLVLAAYEEFLRWYPKNVQALNYLGELLYDRYAAIARAVSLWQYAIALDDTYAPPFNNLAIHYSHTGLHSKSLEMFGRLLELEPDNPDYLFNVVQFYLGFFPELERRFDVSKHDVYKEAMKLSRRAAKLAPDDFQIQQDYAQNFFLAEQYDNRPDWRGAAQQWQKVRALANTEDLVFNAWLYEGRAWKRAGDLKAAGHCFLEAQKIHPESALVQQLLEQTAPPEERQSP